MTALQLRRTVKNGIGRLLANLAIVSLEMYIPSMDRRFYLPEKGVPWKA
jgi:hypothetical protein